MYINCKSGIYFGVGSIFRLLRWGGVPPTPKIIGDGQIKWPLVKKKRKLTIWLTASLIKYIEA